MAAKKTTFIVVCQDGYGWGHSEDKLTAWRNAQEKVGAGGASEGFETVELTGSEVATRAILSSLDM